MGGRRGQAATAGRPVGSSTPTPATRLPRAGDPCPHDHVLLANLLEMRDEQGGWKGGGHGAVAGAPARRHHGRTGGSSAGGGRTGLRHRSRPRPLGAARALEDRRRPRRSYGAPLQAGGRNRSRVPAPRRGLLPCPRRGRPHHPQGQTPRTGGRPDEPLAGGNGRRGVARRVPGCLGRRRPPRPGRAQAP